MVLQMARPWKHPTTGVYYIRERIPRDVAAAARDQRITFPPEAGGGSCTITAKTEHVKASLRTHEPSVAKQRHSAALAHTSQIWDELRRRNALQSSPAVMELDEAIIKRVGEAYYVHLLDEDEDQRLDGFAPSAGEPGPLPALPAATFEEAAASNDAFEEGVRQDYARGRPDEFFLAEVDEVLSWDNFEIRLDPAAPCRKRVARELQAAAIRATTSIRARNKGEPIATPPFPPTPAGSGPPTIRTNGTTQSLNVLFEDWWHQAKAAGRKPSTYESYKNTISGFIDFLKHDAAESVTPEDVINYKNHRLAMINPRTGKPIAAKTVKDSDLAALKTVFGWAVSERRLTSNPAAGITLKLGKPAKLRSKGFTDAEARALLRAADDHEQGNESAKTFAAKRWVPWLCAYTGARVGEMAQLRKQDVCCEEGRWIIHITPEAGTVKTNEARDVVLHQHLIEKGFPQFVAGSEDGHLFIEVASPDAVLGPLQGLKNRLAAFARGIVSDPNVKPTHGWRHRFKTVCLEAGVDHRVADAIQGHSSKTVGDTYGDVTATAQAIALARFPRQGESPGE